VTPVSHLTFVGMTSTPNDVAQRASGLNLLRLLLAVAVLVAHALLVAGVPAPRHTDIGYWAVAGFFCISGYLVTRSALRLPPSTYLRHRLARLMPAFWACLLVTGVALAPLAAQQPSLLDDGLLYAVSNAGLIVVQHSIGGTPAVGHYPGVWNASLWTLSHEFGCYLVVGGLAMLHSVRRARWVGWGLGWVAATALHVVLLRVAPEAPFLIRGFARLLPLFMAGALIQALWPLASLRLRTGVGALAVGCVVVAAVPAYGLQLAAPLLAYALMAIGQRLPCPRAITTHDVSYGTYLYAFPVTQFLAHFWLPRGGWAVAAWLVTIFVVTIGLAAASWLLLEMRALNWARRQPTASTRQRRAELSAARRTRVDERRSIVREEQSDARTR
jgi:peptidoglycan/LPS O-acetylase OafA/YrhL